MYKCTQALTVWELISKFVAACCGISITLQRMLLNTAWTRLLLRSVTYEVTELKSMYHPFIFMLWSDIRLLLCYCNVS